MTVAAAVTALTQLLKWGGVPDRYGVLLVLALALVGTAVWAYSQPSWDRANTFGYFAGVITVASSAAGVFSFTRAGADAVTSLKSPPAGAGQSPTTKMEGG
jgi:formate hydrogenlyase subunit 3/multisubunit Na+/H+ antiporter MnhD subunit